MKNQLSAEHVSFATAFDVEQLCWQTVRTITPPSPSVSRYKPGSMRPNVPKFVDSSYSSMNSSPSASTPEPEGVGFRRTPPTSPQNSTSEDNNLSVIEALQWKNDRKGGKKDPLPPIFLRKIIKDHHHVGTLFSAL
jgi:hypothetical protein